MPYTGRLEVTPLLDIVQIIAYSQQSGLLSVKGSDTKGLLIFQAGNIICAYSPSALPLLVKAAKEQNPDNRLSFRRIQVLAALRELVDISEGDYRFVKKAEPITELEGLDMKLFYASGPLDTGDLLLVLQKAMDEPENIRVTRASPAPSSAGTDGRVHPRYGPIVIQATLEFAGTTVVGYLTNLSEGGTFFHADEFPGPDSECELGFELPWELGHCQAKAKVAWLRSEGPDTRRGVGLSFLEFSPDSKGRIATYLERFQELAADVDFEA